MPRRNFNPAVNYYVILGAEKSDSPKILKKKYRKLAFEFHPDRTGGNADKFKLINESYQVLSSDKDEYDRFLEDLKKPKETPRPQPSTVTPQKPPTPVSVLESLWGVDGAYYQSILYDDDDSPANYSRRKEVNERMKQAQNEKIRQEQFRRHQDYLRRIQEEKKEQERIEKERLEQIKRQRDRSVAPWPDYQELANPKYIDDY